MTEKKNILAKLHAIMLDVEYIQKDGKNTFDSYKYASERAIKEAAYAAIRKHRVVFTLDALDVHTMVMRNKEKEPLCTVAKFKYGFHDVDTGESIEGLFIGTGSGRDEKGFYAAVTGAIKYCLTSCLGLVTGEESNERPTQGNDPENDRFGDETPLKTNQITPRQLEILGKFANDPRIPPEAQAKLFQYGLHPEDYTPEDGVRAIRRCEEIVKTKKVDK